MAKVDKPDTLAHNGPVGQERHISNALPDEFSPTAGANRVISLFDAYRADVKRLGVVCAVLVGSKRDENETFIWNVFSDEDSWLRSERERNCFDELAQLGYQLKKNLAGELQLRVAHATPSRLEKIKQACKQQKIDTVLIEF